VNPQPAGDTGDGAPREHIPSVSFEPNIADRIEIAFKFPPSFLALERMNHVDANPEPDAVESIKRRLSNAALCAGCATRDMASSSLEACPFIHEAHLLRFSSQI